LDPERPVMLSTNCVTREEFAAFFTEGAFDILEMHAYVNPQVGDRQRQQIASFLAVRRGRYPLIVSLRAFEGAGWQPLPPGSLAAQREFYRQQQDLTENLGFYGWDLSPNRGLRQVERLRQELLALML
ncbi:MAG: hypothetical protein AB1634_16000, partial [Thermodesulfobacteriota bacterium]